MSETPAPAAEAAPLPKASEMESLTGLPVEEELAALARVFRRLSIVDRAARARGEPGL